MSSERPDPDRAADSVPDAGAPAPGDRWSDLILGGEATVPAGDYGPPIESRFPDPARRDREVRNLERQVRERLTPLFVAPPLPRLHLGGLVRMYRKFTLRRRAPVDAFGRDPAAVARARGPLETLYRHYFRVEVEGAEHIPDRGPAMLIANHGGALPLDVLLLMEAVRLESSSGRGLRPLVENAFFHMPFLGVAMSRIGAVRANPDNARRLLDDGELVAVFPEGTQGSSKRFAERHELKRFGRGGFAKLAARHQVPLIPVAVIGAAESMPLLANLERAARLLGLPMLPITPTFPLLGPLGLLPLPARWRIHIGAPIDPPDNADDRAAVKDVATRVRTAIEALISAAVERRGRAF
jgi:1-acyl-sn-glycerol-3-phosphate acyltransferase